MLKFFSQTEAFVSIQLLAFKDPQQNGSHLKGFLFLCTIFLKSLGQLERCVLSTLKEINSIRIVSCNNAIKPSLLPVAAISVHKSVIAFCVGVEIFTNAQNAIKRNILYMATFALMSPVTSISTFSDQSKI